MLIIGIESHELTASEREFIQHPAVAGVILFSRNFASKQQLAELCADIRASSTRPQLICVDQEGGRVQRFRDGFAKLPCLERFGELARSDRASALALAREHAFVMASEIIASGLDLSFAPVADLGRGNLAIGNRAFAADPVTVAMFIESYVAGMHDAGMAATLKHFPGHGSVLEDTHFDQAVDSRAFSEIASVDLQPFTAGFRAGADAVMLCTPWPEYRDLDLGRVAREMAGNLLLDGRNFLDPATAEAAGLRYEGIGRPGRGVQSAAPALPRA